MVKDGRLQKPRKGKIISLGLKIPESLYLEFRDGAYSEGFSISEAVVYLIDKYCKERRSE